MAGNFNHAHHFNLRVGNIIAAENYTHQEGSPVSPLEKLVAWIAPEAIHDSDARCDAPKCHLDTRVAVQEEIYGWVVHSDAEPEPKMKWVTGPAGTGKTAIAGSLAERFSKEGLLAASFFFSSHSPHPGQRTKNALIPTIAYQLAQRHEIFKHLFTRAIEENPLVFKKKLQVQMDELLLRPLHHTGAGQPGATSKWPKVIIIDGLDECDVEPDRDLEIPSKGKPNYEPERSKDNDQLEILQALFHACSDPAFPFRIILISRPERVFRTFFAPNIGMAPFASNLVLDEKYDPDADIALFLEAKFNEIRRIYNLEPSWPPTSAIRILVEKSSGQFVYALAIIRFIMEARTGTPHTLLNSVLNTDPRTEALVTNPFVHLDALYTQILQSSPNPTLAVRWLWLIHGNIAPGRPTIYARARRPPASIVNQWLQADAGEAEHLLGPLHSLVKVPPTNDTETPYAFYHKSLFDFLDAPDRAGALFIDNDSRTDFFAVKYLEVCLRPCAYPDPDRFFTYYFDLAPHYLAITARKDALEILRLPPTSIDWWIKQCMSRRKNSYISIIFHLIHRSGHCHWYRCHPVCKLWRYSIMRLCNEAKWVGVPKHPVYLLQPNKTWIPTKPR